MLHRNSPVHHHQPHHHHPHHTHHHAEKYVHNDRKVMKGVKVSRTLLNGVLLICGILITLQLMTLMSHRNRNMFETFPHHNTHGDGDGVSMASGAVNDLGMSLDEYVCTSTGVHGTLDASALVTFLFKPMALPVMGMEMALGLATQSNSAELQTHEYTLMAYVLENMKTLKRVNFLVFTHRCDILVAAHMYNALMHSSHPSSPSPSLALSIYIN